MNYGRDNDGRDLHFWLLLKMCIPYKVVSKSNNSATILHSVKKN
jgi:hypothetical protein